MNNDQHLSNDMKALGVKLGTLLAHANLPPDEKQAWLSILPELSPGQVDRLLSILEVYAAIDPQELSDLRRAIQTINDEADRQLAAAEKQAMDELAKIEQELP